MAGENSLIRCPQTQFNPVASDELLLGQRLSHLETDYPGFSHWYHWRVLRNLKNGTRKFFYKKINGEVAGIVIAKKSDERKICTIWTTPNMRGRGIASSLTKQAIEWLETEHPLISVSGDRLAELQPLFRHLDFRLSQELGDYYRSGIVEYVFNGTLPLTSSANASNLIFPTHFIRENV